MIPLNLLFALVLFASINIIILWLIWPKKVDPIAKFFDDYEGKQDNVAAIVTAILLLTVVALAIGFWVLRK